MSEPPEAPARPKRRRLRWILGGIVGLLLVAALLLPFLLDVERYRGQIEAALHDATGWDAELGDIDFSVWSGMALTVSPARLAAPGDSSYVEIETLSVQAALMPLLSGRLEVRDVTLVRPGLRLVRFAEQDGWVVPAARDAPPAQSEPRTQAPAEGQAADSTRPPTQGAESESPLEVSVNRVRIKAGRVELDDRAAEPPYSIVLENVNLVYSLGGIVSGDADLGEDLGRLAWSGTTGEKITLTLDGVRTELLHRFIGPDLVAAGGALSGEIELGFPLRVDGRLEGDGLMLLAGEQPFDESSITFSVVETDGGGWRLDDMELRANAVRVVGAGTIVPTVDLDIELPETPLDATLDAARSVLPLPLDLRGPGTVSARLRIDQPVDGELTYEAEGNLSATGLHLSEGLPPASDVRAAFELTRAGRLEVRILDGQVAGGPLRGVVRLDSVDPPGKLTFEGGIQDAVLGGLLRGMVGSKADKISGPTGLDARIALDLGNPTLDARALGGRLDLSARQVSLPGWELQHAIDRTLERKLGSAAGLVSSLLDRDDDGGGESATDRVEELMQSVTASVDFDSWPWKLENVAVAAGDVSASGLGTFDPIDGSVDFTLTSHLDADKTAELVRKTTQLRVLVDNRGRLTLPLHIEGTITAPSIGVDLGEALLGGDSKEEIVEGLLKGFLDRRRKKKDE